MSPVWYLPSSATGGGLCFAGFAGGSVLVLSGFVLVVGGEGASGAGADLADGGIVEVVGRRLPELRDLRRRASGLGAGAAHLALKVFGDAGGRSDVRVVGVGRDEPTEREPTERERGGVATAGGRGGVRVLSEREDAGGGAGEVYLGSTGAARLRRREGRDWEGRVRRRANGEGGIILLPGKLRRASGDGGMGRARRSCGEGGINFLETGAVAIAGTVGDGGSRGENAAAAAAIVSPIAGRLAGPEAPTGFGGTCSFRGCGRCGVWGVAGC